jgi:hypothetical protein
MQSKPLGHAIASQYTAQVPPDACTAQRPDRHVSLVVHSAPSGDPMRKQCGPVGVSSHSKPSPQLVLPVVQVAAH